MFCALQCSVQCNSLLSYLPNETHLRVLYSLPILKRIGTTPIFSECHMANEYYYPDCNHCVMPFNTLYIILAVITQKNKRPVG